MNIKEIIEKRQSNREYKPDTVEKEKIMQCIEAAHLAPSACNAQAWKFVVVDEPALIKKMAEAANSMGMNKFVAQAPVIIAVVLESANVASAIGSRIKRKDYTQIDLGIAVENICLQATDLGLGSCIVGWFNEREIRKILQIPSVKRVPLLVTLGYTENEQRVKSRKKIESIYSFNKY
ncbi:MAG: nitroreductase family protein [Ignavibacteriae bacterium]|nr:nitroreductase family protein [Ignavibacteriota bacterium]